PVLRKDFIIDEIQIYESTAVGANAILLIAALLSTEKLLKFREAGETLGIDSIVEVHNEEEMKSAIDSGARIIGVNNRDLRT
ncbi:bifunctional indole-3-glycerol phosphate synthase/phosphoribosylanthranilate isomerase, partial [Escherichia coli]|nr:bifunctional indole-3-glycerol phosphate synthase/phosphoribosylanthranilate isomerase [Escherichia coli]